MPLGGSVSNFIQQNYSETQPTLPRKIDFTSNSSQILNDNPSFFQMLLDDNTTSSNPNTLFWHSGLSPHPYEVIEKPKGVVKCYGCGQIYTNLSYN